MEHGSQVKKNKSAPVKIILWKVYKIISETYVAPENT